MTDYLDVLTDDYTNWNQGFLGNRREFELKQRLPLIQKIANTVEPGLGNTMIVTGHGWGWVAVRDGLRAQWEFFET